MFCIDDIHPDTSVIDIDRRKYSSSQLKTKITQFQHYLDNLDVHKIGILADLNFSSLSLCLASLMSSKEVTIIPAKDSVDESLYDIIFSSDELHIDRETFLRISEITLNNSPINPLSLDHPTTTLISSWTSGTTGNKKKITHKIDSILYQAQYMSRYFESKKRVLLASNINHLGVITTSFLPAFLTGCEIYLSTYWCNEPDFYEFIESEQIQISSIFPTGFNSYLQSEKKANLSSLELVITGGQFIGNDFVNQLEELGVQKTIAFYGSSEALPPVTVQESFGKTINNCLYVGDIVPHCNIRTDQEEYLYVSGPNICHKKNEHIMKEGYVFGDDKGFIEDNSLYLHLRDIHIKNQNNELVNILDIEWNINKYLRKHNINYSFIIALYQEKILLCTLSNLESFIPQAIKISKELYDLAFDEVFLCDKLPFNGIKDQRKLQSYEVLCSKICSGVRYLNVKI